MVPNPYILLPALPEYHEYYTVLDLKDAVFVSLWKKIDRGSSLKGKVQPLEEKCNSAGLCCPQNSPTLFGNVLDKELEEWQDRTLLLSCYNM